MIKDTEGYICETQEEMQDELVRLVREKQRASVWTGKGERKDFDTAISVSGVLESRLGHSEFRVLLSEGTYTYFKPEDVVVIGVRYNGFRDGSTAVIRLTMV
jgi:hypothetical protein